MLGVSDVADNIEFIDPELLELASDEERSRYRNYLQLHAVETEDVPQAWLMGMFPDVITSPMASHHDDLWGWIWSIEPGERPSPPAFVAIWPRGGAKSSSAEMAVVALGCLKKRKYVLYVSDTQDQANEHVQSIATLLESETVAVRYPEMSERKLTQYGHSKGWKVNRIHTASGFVIDAVGLDRAARGIKVEDQRPDLIVFDDLDSEEDTVRATQKKIDRITKKLMPAGATDVAVLGIQNLVIPDGVFSRMADGKADFLTDRELSGPIPAVVDLEVHQEPDTGKWIIDGGTPTWEGQSLETCEAQMALWSYSAFMIEAQHDIDEPDGGMFGHLEFAAIEVSDAELPEKFARVVCWVDPAVTDTDDSDCQGVVVMAAKGKQMYVLYAWEGRCTPLEAIVKAIRVALKWGAEKVGVETDQGGDAFKSVYAEAMDLLRDTEPELFEDVKIIPKFDQAKAGSQRASKRQRAQKMLALGYEMNRIKHLEGVCGMLQRALRRFPKKKPFDLVDAEYWAWADLDNRIRRGKTKTSSSARRHIGDVGV